MSRSARAIAGSIGGHVLHSRQDSAEVAARARDGLWRKYERQVDPDNQLSPQERRRRAEHARKAAMKRLALLSAKARKRARR